MNISEFQDAGGAVFDVSQNELFPFSKTWKKTFETIEKSLKVINNEQEKERILQKVASVVNVLVRYGTTYEDVVLETAELYVFARETGLDASFFKQSYGKEMVESIDCLNNSLDSEEKRKAVFENPKQRYLGKIKIADYIVELTQNKVHSKQYLLEIDKVIDVYNQNSHKALMKMLIEERKKIN